MIRKIITIFFLLLALAYITMAFVIGNQQEENIRCQSIQLTLGDEAGECLLVADTLIHFVEKQYKSFVGISMSTISLHVVNEIVQKYPLVKSCKSYKTIDGVLHINIKQRVPILAFHTPIITHTYLTDDAKVIQLPPSILPHVLVASGNIDLKRTPKQLFSLARLIYKDKFWKSQIEQVYITPRREVELIPRMGNHIIALGTATEIQRKLDRLRIFYDRVLSQIGWQKYNRIDLAYRNQVVCTNDK